MGTFKAVRGVFGACVAVGLLAVLASGALATGGVKLCVPEGPNLATLTPNTKGECPKPQGAHYKLMELGAEGKQGEPGKEGKQGKEGNEGKQGSQGEAGKEGKEGKQGPEGKVGKEGKEGPEGKNALSEEKQDILKGILPCITKVEKGIDGMPTVQFHGCNVQIVNGEGKTATTNGEGNLVIGYDEQGHCSEANLPPRTQTECEELGFLGDKWLTTTEQTGSHNLVLGEVQTFTSYGGILGGRGNAITAPFASVAGGEDNTASGEASAVSSGSKNAATNYLSSVAGNSGQTASDPFEGIPYFCKIGGSGVECRSSS